MSNEKWLPIVGFPPYEVSDHGRVRNTERGNVLTPMWTGQKRKQYATVRFSTRPLVDRKVHILVLEAFVSWRPPGALATHSDDDTRNNRLDNLMWKSSSENAIEGMRERRRKGQVMSSDQALEIKRRREAGERGIDLAAEFGTTSQTVCDIFKGRYASIAGK